LVNEDTGIDPEYIQSGLLMMDEYDTLKAQTWPQVGTRANRANRAILVLAVASSWDSQKAGEGFSIRSSSYLAYR
jgi:hypothetical protein